MEGFLATFLSLLTFLATAQAFVAFDCSRPEKVRQYSLIDAGGCNEPEDINSNRLIEKEWHAEVVQVKQERRVPVLKCLVIETTFWSHCGMFSHSGVTVYSRWRQQIRVEPQDCREAHRRKKIIINGGQYNISVGGAANFFHVFVAGSIDKTTLRCQGGDDGRVIQSHYEAIFTEDDGLVHEVTRVLTIPTNGPKNIQANVMDLSAVDSEFGTWVWEAPNLSCPEGIVPLYHGPATVRTNTSSTVIGGFAIIKNNNQSQVSEFKDFQLCCLLFSFNSKLK